MSLYAKVLIVSEEVYDRVLIKEYLGTQYEFIEISKYNNIEAEVEKLNPDLVIFTLKTRSADNFQSICQYLESKTSIKKANIVICNEDNLFSNQISPLAENAFFITQGMVEFTLSAMARKALELKKIQSLFSSIGMTQKSLKA